MTQLNFIEFNSTEVEASGVGAKKTQPLVSVQQKQEKIMEAKVLMAGRKKRSWAGLGFRSTTSYQLPASLELLAAIP